MGRLRKVNKHMIVPGLIIGIIISVNIISTIDFLWACPFICLSCYFFLDYMFSRCESKDVLEITVSAQRRRALFFWSFFIVLIGQLLYWGAYFPGGFNLDAYGQWYQVHGFLQLDNWHPVITTLIYWLITRVVDTLAMCILFQIVIFSISVAFLLREEYLFGVSDKLLYMIAIWIAVNPAIGMNNVCLIKDVYFSIGVIWSFVLLIRILCSDGKYLKKTSTIIALSLISLFLMMVRHNGALFVVPMFVAMAFFYKKEILRIFISFFIAVIALIVINVGVFSIFDVKQHNNFVGEVVGVPMAAMACAYVNNYDNTPEDVRLFLESIAEREQWEDLYITGEWDSCKWDFGGTELFEKESLWKILQLFNMTVVACPDEAYDSIRNNTRMVWQIEGEVYWDPWVYIEENIYGIRENHIPMLRSVVEAIVRWTIQRLVAPFIWSLGLCIIILSAVCAYATSIGEGKRTILLVPLLVYTFGTMLLLCGPNFRYFHFVSVITLPYVAIMIKPNTKMHMPT